MGWRGGKKKTRDLRGIRWGWGRQREVQGKFPDRKRFSRGGGVALSWRPRKSGTVSLRNTCRGEKKLILCLVVGGERECNAKSVERWVLQGPQWGGSEEDRFGGRKGQEGQPENDQPADHNTKGRKNSNHCFTGTEGGDPLSSSGNPRDSPKKRVGRRGGGGVRNFHPITESVWGEGGQT